MRILLYLFCWISFYSCWDSQSRLERLQHACWKKLSGSAFYEVKLKKEVLHWPLPPPSQEAEVADKAWVEKSLKTARGISTDGLSKAQIRQLSQLISALEHLSSNGGVFHTDPGKYVLLETIEQFKERPDYATIILNIPAYYSALEQRWGKPDPKKAIQAIEPAIKSIEILGNAPESIERKSIREAIAAVKDFIGLCQSTALAPRQEGLR